MTQLPRTDEEIVARLEGERHILDFGMDDLIAALPHEKAKPYLNADVTAEKWATLRTASVEQVVAAAARYLSFALGKAADHRGLSAAHSIEHYRSWLWLLAKDDQVDWEDYAQYGVPILVKVAEVLGISDKWIELATPELRRMALGEPCNPNCAEGCGLEGSCR